MKQGEIIKSFKSKKGNQVVFRYPKPEDFSQVWGFACDLTAEDTFVELSGKAPTEAEERIWFMDVLEKITKKESIHIAVTVNGVYAGGGRVDRGKLRHAHVGHIGLALAPQFRDEGIGSILMQALIDEAKKLGLRLLELSCFENNPRAHHVYEKLGFQTLGVLPGSVAFQGGYVGELKMYLLLR